MKKVLPTLMIVVMFASLVVVQMLVHGQKLTAVNMSENSAKFTAFESQFTKLSGSTTKGSLINLKKQKEPIVILNFWASWCKPCLSEFGSLNQLVASYPGDIKVVGINNDIDDQMKSIKKIEDKYNLTFESIADKDGEIAESFNITRVPASIIYHKGKVLYYSNKESDFMSPEIKGLIESKLPKK